MITTIADLIEQIQTKMVSSLPPQSYLQHPGLEGEIYEGLTRKLLGRAVFKNLDLRIVSGKIRGESELSQQIDCMLVTGNGEQIPHTDEFIYNDEQVIAIFEVKKTLTSKTLREALELFRNYYDRVAKCSKIQFDTIQDSWRTLFGRNLHMSDLNNGTPHENAVQWALTLEGKTPLRVVYAFRGFKSAFGLRAAFLAYLKSLFAQKTAWNLVRLPALVICGNNSILKCDGGPYIGVHEHGRWYFLGSRSGQPWRLLLECLWTRLAYLFKLDDAIFGEDLEVEAITPLCSAKARIANDKGDIGWEYFPHEVSRKHLREPEPTRDWAPVELNDYEEVIVGLLGRGDEIFIDDEDFASFLKEYGAEPVSTVKALHEKRIISRRDKRLELLTDKCSVVFMPDGRTISGENKSGRLERYALKETLKERGQS